MKPGVENNYEEKIFRHCFMHCCITGSRVFFQYRCFNDGSRVKQQRVSWDGSGYKRGYDKGHSRGKVRNR